MARTPKKDRSFGLTFGRERQRVHQTKIPSSVLCKERNIKPLNCNCSNLYSPERSRQCITDNANYNSFYYHKQLNIPLNFDSNLRVCIEKMNADLIFNPPEKRRKLGSFTSVKYPKKQDTNPSGNGVKSEAKDSVTQFPNSNVTSMNERSVMQSLDCSVSSIDKSIVTQSSDLQTMDINTYNVTGCDMTSTESKVTQSLVGELDDSSSYLDVLPPSTTAQKEARRAKRRLQIEQWKLSELTRTRNERYRNRLKRRHGSNVTPQRRKATIRWKKDLVQVFFIE